MNFFKVLLSPDEEEREDEARLEVTEAANLLDIGEFQFLLMAYRNWFGRSMPEAMISPLFQAYMYHSHTPAWARHYARRVLKNFGEPLPARYREMSRREHLTMAGGLALVLILLWVASVLPGEEATSRLPPYFTAKELEGAGR